VGDVSGDDVKGSKAPDAQQNMPDGAEPARVAASGSGEQPEITWVGAQHLMRGYCGRAVKPGGARVAEPPVAPQIAGAGRHVAVRHRPRGLVARIGPRAAADDADLAAKAA
jgi:hypothetical protein